MRFEPICNSRGKVIGIETQTKSSTLRVGYKRPKNTSSPQQSVVRHCFDIIQRQLDELQTLRPTPAPAPAPAPVRALSLIPSNSLSENSKARLLGYTLVLSHDSKDRHGNAYSLGPNNEACRLSQFPHAIVCTPEHPTGVFMCAKTHNLHITATLMRKNSASPTGWSATSGANVAAILAGGEGGEVGAEARARKPTLPHDDQHWCRIH